jgi:hypothetical protein
VTAQGLLYDTRRRCYYGKPLLRGWLHLALFPASLVTGTLVLTAVHGGVHILPPSQSTSRPHDDLPADRPPLRGLVAALTHLMWMDAPELLVGGTFVALGCGAGTAPSGCTAA